MAQQAQDVFKRAEELLSKVMDEIPFLSDDMKKSISEGIRRLKEEHLNIMITGATGAGKSSTIDALFGTEIAEIGKGVNPETMDVRKFELNHLILWDTPGFGDGEEADKRHAEKIAELLDKKDEKGDFLIDMVLVILDGASRDMGTAFDLINNKIIPHLGDNEGRLLVAINKCDMAMGGRHYNFENGRPDSVLEKFLKEKVDSVARRIKDSTGVTVSPIYYAAGYKEAGMEQEKPFNLGNLLALIVENVPKKKRLQVVQNRNENKALFAHNDPMAPRATTRQETVVEYEPEPARRRDSSDYEERIGHGVMDTILDVAGTVLGAVGGPIAKVATKAIGGVLRTGWKAVKGFFSLW